MLRCVLLFCSRISPSILVSWNFTGRVSRYVCFTVLIFIGLRKCMCLGRNSGLMVSALYSGLTGPDSSPGQGHISLCSWARHLLFTVPLFTQVYKLVPVNLMLRVTLIIINDIIRLQASMQDNNFFKDKRVLLCIMKRVIGIPFDNDQVVRATYQLEQKFTN